MELEGDRCASRHVDRQIGSCTMGNDGSEIYFQLMSRYSRSPAAHHRHLVATAAAIRSILSADESPPNPSSYFTVAIENLSNPELLDSTEISALLSMVSIIVPLIPKETIEVNEASAAVEVLTGLMKREDLGAAAISAAVKCWGALMADVRDSDDWDSVGDGFETVLAFTVDRRPKVRRAARESLEKVLKSLRSAGAVEEGSRSVLELLRRYTPLAPKQEDSEKNGAKGEEPVRLENLEVLHVLNLLKLIAPCLSEKSSSIILSDLITFIPSSSSGATRLLLETVETYFKTVPDKIVSPHIDNIIDVLSACVSSSEKNPVDVVMLAVTLLKISMDKLLAGGSSSGKNSMPRVLGSVAGLLFSSDTIASWSSNMMKELVGCCVGEKAPSFRDESPEGEDAAVIESTCEIFANILRSCGGAPPNEHILGVIALLFQKLGKSSLPFMRDIVLKLAGVMNDVGQDTAEATQLQNCFGSAVVALGPERILSLVPVSVSADGLTCSNTWLLPILKRHVVGASLSFYIDHIVPLATHFQQASRTAKKTSAAGQEQDVRAHARGLWRLLSAFCRYPVDCCGKFGSLAQLLIRHLKKKSFMHEDIGTALQLLVNQNKSVLSEDVDDESDSHAKPASMPDLGNLYFYSKKTARRNLRSMASHSFDLLHALVRLFVDSNVKKRSHLKDAIGCVASITDSSAVKNIFTSLLKEFHIVNDEGEFTEPMVHRGGGREASAVKRVVVILELACSLVGSVEGELVDVICNLVLFSFKIQGADQLLAGGAYGTLSRILVKHPSSFSAEKYSDVVDLLLRLKPPSTASSLRNRFACFSSLVVRQILEMSPEDDNLRALPLLGEIILTLKVKGETRKVAFEALLAISDLLRKSSSCSCDSSAEPYHRLFHVILGWLPGSSPQVKSGAVCALSVLVHRDPDICIRIPGLVTSIASLLHEKAAEVIKAALGFVKVLASCSGTRDLLQFLPDVAEILPWSRFSRHYFKSKVTAILEIALRKCGYGAVELVAPEKYKRFVRSVFQNRHHRPMPTTATPGAEAVLATVSPGRESDTLVPTKKRERENKQNRRRLPPGLRRHATERERERG